MIFESLDPLNRMGNLLDSHKKQILQSKLLDGDLSILSSIQLFLFYAFDKQEIIDFTEADLVKNYINCLIKIKSDLKSTKGTLEIVINVFGVIDSEEFLLDLQNKEYKNITSLHGFVNFLHSLSSYRIPSRNIRKLVRKLGLLSGSSMYTESSSKAELAEQARKHIKNIVKSIPLVDQKKLLSVGIGKSGLKSEVLKRMEDKDFNKYFSANHKTFSNRWAEVLPQIKSTLID